MSTHPKTEVTIAVDRIPIRRALISVFDKMGLDRVANSLAERGVEIWSTGGTEKYLRGLGIAVRSVSDVTQSPEVFDGRLKTLHPVVHGGLLFRRELASHVEQAAEHGIPPIDLLIVNLYPFEETRAKVGATQEDIIEQIDIGGPAMLRSAAKNFRGVALLTSPMQYERFLSEIEREGSTSSAFRFDLAREGFELVAHYDKAIADYFRSIPNNGSARTADRLEISLPLIQSLRYGENPQQQAALYGEELPKICRQLWGKELSYNNILDMSSALGLIAEFLPYDKTVAAIIKHMNPCGVAEGSDPLDAFNRAFETDPESPFGGIIAVNAPIDGALAERLNAFFSEVILAPEFSPEALELLKKKKDRRLIRFDPDQLQRAVHGMVEVRSVIGGILRQSTDRELLSNSALSSVTSHAVTDGPKHGLTFANKVVKHLKSNAIAFCGMQDGFARTLGLGAGQTSRVESVRIAIEHANRNGLDLRGSFVASDAFFPFADSLNAIAEAGAAAVIEPGGSVRDAEVVKAAEERGIALVMTGQRHFRH
ncbi:MAG: bifunctional phosphoribosylaminoimidazolecarboxamide formyltransferase/IMP cyclohydrolase [Bacteroidota bacterium]|nr:bifunctional phosphoribosylaminoimidazolecarboxamide formyltransferase/IMP cyclohydrolase [Bacteroidota bacterium]MDP4233502.1 bifunctional phosphoribosylaminoimidazolecarboxamide formyltransferase/IMP cyclohydrolase [Bacteroidota bacterium]MDP4243379.1 bifunctional phosphoribosylaminoimidazolecarboxamide formyltransferase/IMP cyclohydrolase [Bacteroidota bacterium]MDP4287934.1 bifunctional phosphoribosylaminoimidazolecarboxamide formyltransferase/IMP cyclohydrolase [Bacteroidota bacterium]